MTTGKLYIFFMILLCQCLFAQQDSIALKEVIVSDLQLKNFSNTQSVLKLNDSVIEKNQPSLTALLNYNSTIYFKENGFGMVSSPSFRGTTAQQTAVIWNGININSQLNGQTDFNTITANDYDAISVRAGGGSAIYGSSAIGGSIHLNNDLKFGNRFQNELLLNYGSFNTIQGNYKISASDEKFSVNAGISRNSSDNDYKRPGSDKENVNGQFYNTSFTGSFGYKINASNYLKLYSQFFDGERNFSLIFASDMKTKYRDTNSRNMLEWDYFSGRFVSKVKVAALSEAYQYFPNIASDSFTNGKVESYIGKYDLAFNITEKMLLNAVIDYTKNKGKGSDIEQRTREIASGSLLFKHQIGNKFGYELAVRKELTNNYKSPLLFSAGTYCAIADFYKIKINGSRNFRVPTFNDLYWQPGGNTDLNPESSYQGELGNEITFRNFKMTLTGYYIDIKNMIQWVPGSSFWSPENVKSVHTYGGEAILNWSKNFNKHRLVLNGTYAYTVSENQETKKQLIYVPYHKMTGALSYSWQKFSLDYQLLFNGEVFTRTDNNAKYNLDSYTVSNVMAGYNFGTKSTYKIGFQVRNLWNEKYESVASRYFPERNFNIYLNLKF